MHEFSPENLRNPAQQRRAAAMRQILTTQLDSTLQGFVPFRAYIRYGASRAGRALTPLRCKHLTVRLQHALRDVIINFIFAARTVRRGKGPRQLQRAERAADCGSVPAARRIIFLNVFFRPCAKASYNIPYCVYQ